MHEIKHNALNGETTKNVDIIVAAYQCCHSAPNGSCCDKLLWLNARSILQEAQMNC